MSQPLAPLEIPDKPSFKPSEVCDLLGIPTYVLRTWENEFKDLGTARTPGGARTYRRPDVELAARIKALVFAEHLTLAGVRRRLEQEQLLTPPPEEAPDEPPPPPASAGLSAPARERLGHVKQELRSLLNALTNESRPGVRGNASDTPSEGARLKGRQDRSRRGTEGSIPALPGLGDAPETNDVRLDEAALNFASVTVPPPAPTGRKRR